MGLYDAILIKNNHIAAAGGVRNALERARAAGLPIEIEVRTREELREALDCGAAHLLLDNLTPAEAADWIARNRRPRQGGALRRHHARNRPRLCRDGRRFRLRRRHHALGARHGHQLPAGAGVIDVARLRAHFPSGGSTTTPTVDSTMRAAAASWTSAHVVLADEQTAGQGRHGHAWHSEAGTGIYCSDGADARRRCSTLALGLAAVEAIAQSHRHRLRPALAQRSDARRQEDGRHPGATGRTARPSPGIGINVNHDALSRRNCAAIATSLRIHAGREFSREDILLALLPAVDSLCRRRPARPFSRLFTHASSYAARTPRDGGAAGRRRLTGTTAGLDPAGFLIVRQDDGTDTLILAGGVRAAGS